MTTSSGLSTRYSPERRRELWPLLSETDKAELDQLIQPTDTDKRDRYAAHPDQFIDECCQVYDATSSKWLPFTLWPAQREVLAALNSADPADRQLCILKARQLGLTWLCIAWLLHLVLFRPNSTALLFSRRDDEAMELLGRLTNMHKRLPIYLRDPQVKANAHEWRLSNGSRVMAFPTGTGDSYTATAVLYDEFDLVDNQAGQLGSVKPTVDAGGKLILLSRADKSRPINTEKNGSAFKRIYMAAAESKGKTGWRAIFLPWHARPGRTAEWYATEKAGSLANYGSLDYIYEQYPATDTEALSARELDKRLPIAWIESCYKPLEPLDLTGHLSHLESQAPSIPGLRVFKVPDPRCRYVVSGDPAQGLPDSDPSAIDVMDADTLEQVATLAQRVTPAVFGGYVAKLASWYNRASVLIEENNHGNAVILWLKDNSPETFLLIGPLNRPGWQTNSKSKDLLFDLVAEKLREGSCIIHDFGTKMELAEVETSTLAAPEGSHDDKAMAFALCVAGADLIPRGTYNIY
jgi:hypothetical protein